MIKLLLVLFVFSLNYSPEARSSDRIKKTFKDEKKSSKKKAEDKNKSENKDKFKNKANSKDTSKLNILRRHRLFNCKDLKDVEEKCREYLYRIPSVLITKNDTVLAFAGRRLKNLRKKGHFIRDWHHETA